MRGQARGVPVVQSLEPSSRKNEGPHAEALASCPVFRDIYGGRIVLPHGSADEGLRDLRGCLPDFRKVYQRCRTLQAPCRPGALAGHTRGVRRKARYPGVESVTARGPVVIAGPDSNKAMAGYGLHTGKAADSRRDRDACGFVTTGQTR